MQKVKHSLKKYLLFFSLLITVSQSTLVHAADLLEVYKKALANDQIFQQAISQRLATKEGVPISLASLLPTISGTLSPSITKTDTSGLTIYQGSNTVRGYQMQLTVSQTVFNFSQFYNLSQQYSFSKKADATLNAALQDLMLRVAKAYFAVLQDEDNLRYIAATKEAYAKQLDQITQQYKVGLKTVTDVYTAEASYDSSVAQYIAAENTLADDKENLRVITGIYYPRLSALSEDFPLVSPSPANIEAWVRTAEQQNWQIRASQYSADAARKNIKQQFAGHFPTLQVNGNYSLNYNRSIADQPEETVIPVNGPSHSTVYGGNVMMNIPLVQGGLVTANTQLAKDNYQVAFHQLDQQVRSTVNTTRQSYLGVLSGISQVHADKKAIKSSISSLEGLQEGYRVGTQTLVDVLNQQKQVVQSQQTYVCRPLCLC